MLTVGLDAHSRVNQATEYIEQYNEFLRKHRRPGARFTKAYEFTIQIYGKSNPK